MKLKPGAFPHFYSTKGIKKIVNKPPTGKNKTLAHEKI